MKEKAKVKRLVLIALTFLTVSTSTTLSDERIRVLIEVQAPEKVKALMESYISRELRNLGDVEAEYYNNTYQDSDLRIYVLVAGMQPPTGYSIAVTLTKTLNMRPYLKENLSMYIKMTYDRVNDFERMWALACGTNKLRETCTRLIAEIDTQYIQSLR